MGKINLDTFINLRVTAQVKKDFFDKANRMGRRPMDILRQMIEAYIEGRPASDHPTHNKGES